MPARPMESLDEVSQSSSGSGGVLESVVDFFASEVSFYLVAVLLAYVTVLPHLSLKQLININPVFVTAYLPLRVGLGTLLHLASGVRSVTATGGLLEDLTVVAAAAASYITIAHALPGVDLTGTIKTALGKKAAGISRAALRISDHEFSRVIYFAAAIMAVSCAFMIIRGAFRICCCAGGGRY